MLPQYAGENAQVDPLPRCSGVIAWRLFDGLVQAFAERPIVVFFRD